LNLFASNIIPNKKILRLSKGVVRIIVNIFWRIPGFPLISSRIDALTGKCVYNSNKIQRVLGFKYSMTLEQGFELFAKQK